MKVGSRDLKIQTLEKKGESNFSMGGATMETFPHSSPSCLFCRSSQTGVYSDGPVTQKILETTMPKRNVTCFFSDNNIN